MSLRALATACLRLGSGLGWLGLLLACVSVGAAQQLGPLAPEAGVVAPQAPAPPPPAAPEPAPVATGPAPLSPPLDPLPSAPRMTQTISSENLRALFEADQIDALLAARRMVRLRGAARAELNGQVVEAEDLLVDLTDDQRPLAWARGGVRYGQGAIDATVEDIQIDLATRTGLLTNARLEVALESVRRLRDLLDPDEQPDRLIITAERAETKLIDTARRGERRVFEADGVRVTLPTKRDPQLGLRARHARLQMGPSGRLDDHVDFFQANNARLMFGDKPAFSLPRLHVGKGGVYLPMAGVNGTHGVWVETVFGWQFTPELRLRVTPRLGTTHLISGSVSLEHISKLGKFGLNATLRERTLLPVQRTPVSYARLPEISWESPRFQLGRRLGHLEVQTGVGYLKEYGTVSGWRARAEAQWVNQLLHTPTTGFQLHARTRYSWGEGGYQYGWAGLGASLEHVFFRRLWVQAGIHQRYITGSTPFRHELVETPLEVLSEARLRLGNHWVIENHLAYDVNNGQFSDQRAGLLRRDGLLEYGLLVRTLPSFELQITADVLGF